MILGAWGELMENSPTDDLNKNKASKVAWAAMKLVNAGVMPTVQKVRDQIGGSPNVRGPQLKAWKNSPEGQAALQALNNQEYSCHLDTDIAIDKAILSALAPLRAKLRAEGQQAAETIEAEKETQIEQLQAQLTAKVSALKTTRAELSGQQEALQLINADHTGALKTIEEQKEDLVRAEERIGALEQQLNESNALKSAAQTQAHRERERLERTRDGHLEQLHNLQREHGLAIANKEHAIDRAREAQQACEQRIVDLEKSYAATSQERDTLKNQSLPQLQAQVDILDKKLSLSQSAYTDLQQDRERCDAKNAELRITNQNLLEHRNSDQKSIEALEARLTAMEKELSVAKASIVDKDLQMKALTDKLIGKAK